VNNVVGEAAAAAASMPASMIYTYAGIQWCHVEVVFLLDFLAMTLD